MEQEETYLKTKRDVARYFSISLGTVERLMRNGLKYVKVGGLVRFRPEDIAEYLEKRAHVAEKTGDQ